MQHGILFLPFRSVSLAHCLSPTSPCPTPYTCCGWRCLLARLCVGWLARGGCGGTTGVAWTEINIRRASTYCCPLARTLPASLMFVSRAVSLVLFALASNFDSVPRSSNRGDPSASTPPSLCPALYLGFTGRPHPPSLIHSPTPAFPRGWTNMHTHARIHTRAHVARNASARALANQAFLYRVCFDM